MKWNGIQCEGIQCEGIQCEGTQCEGIQCEGTQCEGTQCEGTQCEGIQCEGTNLFIELRMYARISEIQKMEITIDRLLKSVSLETVNQEIV